MQISNINPFLKLNYLLYKKTTIFVTNELDRSNNVSQREEFVICIYIKMIL